MKELLPKSVDGSTQPAHIIRGPSESVRSRVIAGISSIFENSHSCSRRLPSFSDDLHQRGLFVRQGNLALFIEAGLNKIADESITRWLTDISDNPDR